MSKQKLKLLATATPGKTRPEKTLVELTEDQLKAIAGGRLHPNVQVENELTEA